MRKELLTEMKYKETAQRRWKLAAFQPQKFYDCAGERHWVCMCLSVRGGTGGEGIPGPGSG